MPHHKATKFMKYFIFIMYSDVTCIFPHNTLNYLTNEDCTH